MTERKTKCGPGPETQGGGFRGGPKRWTGKGPAPARHIPWPEIFRHHISLCEGHLKMIDMVRKHTVEGTGNWRTIMDCIQRAKEILYTSKQVSRSFLPPPNQREEVPLGSSSASMYPGYSPADHEYGKAAEDYGRVAAEAKAKGIDIKHPDIEYEIGQAKGAKRIILAGVRAKEAAVGEGSGSGSGSGSDVPNLQRSADGAAKQAATNGEATTNAQANQAEKPKATREAAEEDMPNFIIDTNPTPVNIPGSSTRPHKRSATPPEPVEAKKHKKAKMKHDSEFPSASEEPKMEFQDISREVAARMKEKEEKKKRKTEKKRKREPEAELAAATNGSAATTETGKAKKKKKSKHSDGMGLADRPASKKRAGEDDEGGEDGEGRKKKKKKVRHIAEHA